MARYARILRTPRVAALIAATTLGRIPFAINGLAALLFLREVTGSFALAGLGTGALALGVGIGAPFAARLIDRRGVGMLVPLATVHAAGVVALVSLGLAGAPGALLALACAVIGTSFPPSGSVLRARWPALLGDEELVRTAYALDSVTIEISFVSGPLITALIVALAGPEFALLISAGLVIAGAALFVWLLPDHERDEGAPRFGGALGVLVSPAIRIVALTTIPVGFCIGTIEVALPAFSHAEGRDALGGVLLAVWSAASGVGGLVYGARAARRELDATYLLIALLFPLACLPLILASSPLAIAGLVILAGLPIAPLIASRNELLAAIAPRGSGAEAFTWLTTALVSGLAAGAAAAGILVEAQGWRAAVIAGVVVAAIGGVVAAICRDRLVPVAAT